MKVALRVGMLVLFSYALAQPQSFSTDVKGQASLVHSSSIESSFTESPTTLRYIPQIRGDYEMNHKGRLGVDAALNLYNFSLGDSLVDMEGEFYRLTLRYDSPNSQIRFGLQKINFGPARMLRVLQWFDEVDQRDPLALSPGVWAAMGRYFFDNGVDLRIWTMADAPTRLATDLG
ncbi:hypothetical protein HQ531_11495 [bacterium]|nr:hypothetical protein [bacterium]